jgi:hypothetical protein
VPRTLTVIDSHFGTFPATFSGCGGGSCSWTTGSVNVNYPGDGGAGCSAVNPLPVTYKLINTGVGSWTSEIIYQRTSIINNCPVAHGGSALTISHVLGSVSCGKFTINFASPGSQAIYSHAVAGTYTVDWS